MDSHKVGKKNPLKFTQVKKIIKKNLKLRWFYNIIKIPVTKENNLWKKSGLQD